MASMAFEAYLVSSELLMSIKINFAPLLLKGEYKSINTLTAKTTHQNITLYPEDNSRLANLCGLFDENLRHIESHMKVEISNRGNAFRIKGSQINVPLTSQLIEELYKLSEFEELTPKHLHMYMNKNKSSKNSKINEIDNETVIKLKKITLKPKSKAQELYVKGIYKNDLSRPKLTINYILSLLKRLMRG